MNPMNNTAPQRRRTMRLQGYDYSQAGAYFITIVTQGRMCLFGDVVDGETRLNDAGRLAQAVWDELPRHYPNVELDAFVIMPNHVHGIIVLVGAGLKPALAGVGDGLGAGLKPAPTKCAPLSEIVRAFKTFSARRVNEYRRAPGLSVWQRNYYEHIIRSEKALDRIREYIATNPLQWSMDRENPAKNI
jgi:REP element-mobilizing transposase RayT